MISRSDNKVFVAYYRGIELAVRIRLVLAYIGNYVATEAVYALFEPIIANIRDLLSYLGIFPVKVGLLFMEEV